MLQVLERDYKQTPDYVEKEFPNSRLLMALDNSDDEEGRLLVVCDSISSIPELNAYIKDHNKQYSHIIIFGFFEEEVDDYATY